MNQFVYVYTDIAWWLHVIIFTEKSTESFFILTSCIVN